MGYRIFTDVCADLPLEYINQNGLTVFTMTVSIEGREYAIAADPNAPAAINGHEFYEKLRRGIPAKTAQVNVEAYREHFERVLKEGDDVLHLAFSSGLSGNCSSACVVAKELMDQYPERKVLVVDSLCASLGQGLYIHLVVQKRDAGMGLMELAQYATDIRQRVHHWFTVDDLSHLRRGGRVSGAAAFIGSMLSIKPILLVDAEGHLIPVDKVQGRKRSIKHLADMMEREIRKPITEPILISHGDAREDAEYLAQLIRERVGADVMMINQISPIIGCHSGPGTIALFFVSDAERQS